MDIDMATLKAVVVDKGLSLQTVVGSIEQALSVAISSAHKHCKPSHQRERIKCTMGIL